MSVEGNVALPLQAQSGHSFRFWCDARHAPAARERAHGALRSVGLADRGAAAAEYLAHGERRQLDLAMALAGRPKLLLLDEPMAGLGAEDSADMVELLRALKKQHAIVLVEHDMDAVFSLADSITVLVGGRVLTTGTPAEVRNDPMVRTAYLGDAKSDPHKDLTAGPVVRLEPRRHAAAAARSVQADANVLLEVDHIDAGYGHCPVLFDVSLRLNDGEVIALLGRNGIGKSTLLKSVIGALKPTRGTVRFRGRDLAPLPLHRIARLGIGLVPEGRHIFPSLTVEENLLATAVMRRGAASWTLDKIYALFPRLAERRRNMGNLLSGGEQQMLAIGRALMTNPWLLVLDEATEGLAPLIRNEIWRVVENLKRLGQSIIVVDKDLDALGRVADRCYLLDKGRVIWSGETQELSGELDFVQRHMTV